jgi:hypothetical protein
LVGIRAANWLYETEFPTAYFGNAADLTSIDENTFSMKIKNNNSRRTASLEN